MIKENVKKFFTALGLKIKNYFSYNIEGKRKRIWELDILRGIVLLIVTFDHLCLFTWSWGILPYQTEFGHKLADFATLYCESDFRAAVQPLGLFFLCFLAGINSSFTRSDFRRVVKAWIFSAIFMGGYYLTFHKTNPELFPSSLIFNIIIVITICYTVWWLLNLIRCPYWVRFGLGMILVCIGIWGFYMYFISPSGFYIDNAFLSLFLYNEHGVELSVVNFEPVLPHLGWFILGGVTGKYLYKDKATHCKNEDPPKALLPLLWIGKHSLAVYLFLPLAIAGILRAIIEIVALCI